jgi:hypothetical protein
MDSWKEGIARVNIEIERLSEDGLTRQVWFVSVRADSTMKDVRVRLEEWRTQRRLTCRHKWELDGEGYRHRQHNGHHHAGFKRPAAEVPFGEDIINEARQRVINALNVQGPIDPTC